MATIRIQISKTDAEWSLLEEVIKEKYAKRNLEIPTGKGYNSFIRAEINKLFQEIQIGDCAECKTPRTRKKIFISVSDSTESKLNCLAKKQGISVSVLISRMVIDPYLP